MSGPHHWSETAADNGSSDPNADLRPGRPANTVLGAIRGLMETVALARDDDLGGLVATLGANNRLSVTTNEGLIDIATGVNGIPAAITKPFAIALTFSAAPTAVATTPPHLFVDGFDCGPVLHADGSALADGDLTTGRIYHVLGDMAASTDTKVTRVRCLEISPAEIADLARAAALPLIAALGTPVQKAGDTMTGALTMLGAGIGTRYYIPGTTDFLIRALVGNRLQVCDGGATVEFLSFGADGSISTRQLGDLRSYIESRASLLGQQQGQAAANNCVQNMRWVYAGDMRSNENVGLGSFNGTFGGIAMKCDHWTYDLGIGNGACADYAHRYRYLQAYIPNLGWVTVGAAS